MYFSRYCIRKLTEKLEIKVIKAIKAYLKFFPGPLAFCKKAVERVSSEKNILNSSVECVEWSGVEWFFFRKSHMYVHH